MTICIIGIDCATDSRKVGLARGFIDGDRLFIDRLAKPGSAQSVADVVGAWVAPDQATLFALDAPLGWPALLAEQLITHQAGDVMNVDANILFRRYTDRFIKRMLGKQPLDVGADRIARTALAALKYLDGIGKTAGRDIRLAWSAELKSVWSAIEVYPAATLMQSGMRSVSYKKKEHSAERHQMLLALSDYLMFSTDTSVLIEDDDVLDAAVCVLAGSHFLRGQCLLPDDLALAKKEGWIWVRAEQG